MTQDQKFLKSMNITPEAIPEPKRGVCPVLAEERTKRKAVEAESRQWRAAFLLLATGITAIIGVQVILWVWQ